MSLPKPRHSSDSAAICTGQPKYGTPKNSALTRLKSLSDKGCDSPSVKVPASPLLTRLGYGTGVNVYLMKRGPKEGLPRSPWAIKRLNQFGKKMKSQIMERMKTEIEILRNFKHPNIIAFRAEYKKQDAFAMEVADCALSDQIEKLETEIDFGNEKFHFDPIFMKKMIKDVASGLEYLHNNANMLHGDIKPANILIKGDIFKLCDFGTTLVLDENKQCNFEDYTTTEPFMPPEAVKYLYNVTEGSLLKADNYLSPKSDVWHIGLTVFEMMTLKTPHFCAVDLELQDIDEEDDDYSEIWDETFHQMIGRRPAVPHWIGNKLATNPEYQTIFDIFIACSENLSAKRPTTAELISIVQ